MSFSVFLFGHGSDIQYVPPELRIAQHKSAYVPAPEADKYDRNKSGS